MNFFGFMFYFRLILGGLWTVLLGLATYGSSLGGDTAILCGYAFLLLTLPFGLLWAFVVLPFVPEPFLTSPIAQWLGMISVDVFTLVFWLILLPMLWNRHRRRRS